MVNASKKDISEYRVSNLVHGLTVLETLVHNPGGLGVSELGRELGLSKNLVFRITSALHEMGYLQRDEQAKTYTLSRKLITMGYSTEIAGGLIRNSLDLMCELRDEVKETVVLCVLQDNQAMVLEQIPALHRFRFVVEPGMLFSVHGSAPGKAILAMLPQEEQARRLRQIKYLKYTANTITSRRKFEAELENVSKRGYALDLHEGYDGINCVAAPIYDGRGVVTAALNVSGPSLRFQEKTLTKLAPVVMDFAKRISQRLGFETIKQKYGNK